ncbi:hypothetical protein AC138_19595 [Pseudomonas putida]|nr:hypothetical protein AC138_19595 [Pseudomonas putida]KMY31089.1 hypothetical protein AA993_19680 [Pseudomonas putida]
MFIDLGDANLLVRITTVVVDDKYLTIITETDNRIRNLNRRIWLDNFFIPVCSSVVIGETNCQCSSHKIIVPAK